MDYPSTSGDHNNTTNAPKKSRVDSCFVPMCPSTSRRFPNKLFLTGPSDPNLRKKWLQAAKRIDNYSPKTIIRCCEDHFDIEKDMENYMEYKIMGTVKKVRIKPGCIPTRFTWDSHTQSAAAATGAAAAVKQESSSKNVSLPPFCHACFSVGRRLAAASGDGLRVFNSLVDTRVSQPLLLCWECQAQLRHVRAFRQRARAVQWFLARHHDLPHLEALPPSLSRLVTERTDGACVELAEAESRTQAEVELKPRPVKDEPRHLLEFSVEIKQERLDTYEEPTYSEQAWQLDEIVSPDAPLSLKQEEPVKTEPKKERKRRNQKYLLCFKTNAVDKFCIEKFYREVPINDDELQQMLERDRRDELFLQCRYRCEQCVRGWRQESSFIEHNNLRHSESNLPFQCNICSVRLSNKHNLRAHVGRHYHARQCVECEYRTAAPGLMRRHVLRRHHRSVQCRACDALFHNVRAFFKHYRSLHRRFECDHCGQTRHSRASFETHIAGHSGKTCRQCGEQFPSRAAYAKHRQRDHPQPAAATRDRPYCVECDKHFSSTASYKMHLDSTRAHKGSGPRKGRQRACPECGKVYSTVTYMRAHYQYAHQGIVHKCEQCDATFHSNSSYVQHMKRHRPDYRPPRNKLCTVCGNGFATKWHLENHMRTHTGERPFACASCGARFGQRVALQAHVNYTHLKRQRKHYDRRGPSSKSHTAPD